jgi:ArsR family transcriptional regulator
VSGADERLAGMYKALASPVRLSIVRWMARHPGCICNDIVQVSGRAQSTISQHLAVLREAGIICGTVRGPATCYCLDRVALKWLDSRTRRLISEVTRRTVAF